MSRCSLSVTDRRVVGKSSFKKVVDLPLKQISAVALGRFSQIIIATSSGKVHFWLIENRAEVYSTLSDCISNISSKSGKDNGKASETYNAADELKKFKELLDCGVITQEEFDEKKKQLLNL